MASLMDSVGGLLTPDNIGAISNALGMDASRVQKGLEVADATVLGSLSQSTSTPDGADALMKLFPNGDDSASGTTTDMLSRLLGMLSGGGTSADMMNNVLGGGVNGISGTLSKSLGFDVRPLLIIAVPIVVSQIAKLAKAQNLNSAGVAEMLKDESRSYMADPKHKEVADMVQSSLKAGDEALALRRKFTEADWTKLRLGPLAAVYLVVSASPSGSSEQTEELAAAVIAISDAIQTSAPTALIGAAFGGGLTRDEIAILKRDAPPRARILAAVTDGVAIVQKVSPADAPSYNAMILDAAQRTAEAVKEGGFLGMGGTLVSAEEQQALDDIRAAVG